MTEQLLLISCPGARCAWCNKLVDPAHTKPVAVLEDPLDIELVTGFETVCYGCLEETPLELEIETGMVSYQNYWRNGFRYEYAEVERNGRK